MILTNKSLPFWYLLVMMALTLLGGCSLATKTDINPQPIMLSEDAREFALSAATITAPQARSIAKDYKSNGEGIMTVAVTYDHLLKPEKNAIKLAQAQAAAMQDYLKGQGITQINTTVIPSLTAPPGTVQIAYQTLSASAPSECDSRMPGVGRVMNHNPDYQFGCENKRMLAEMIAYPRDLEGNDANPDMSSQRLNIPLDLYNAGEPITDTEIDIGTGVAE